MTEQRNRRAWALAQLGRTLGSRYRIDALRGTGGMGAVFEGTHLHVDRKVAIKLLFPESSSDAESLQREAKHAASISGHGVVAITDFDFTDDGAFLVMDLLEGRSLRERLRDGPLSSAEARAVIGEVLETLHEVHEAGLVHGDLKPSNVFLTHDGSTKLLDFGVSRSIGSEDGRVRGTPAYMAPEQLDGVIAASIDLYAVGALAYEALSARRPYAGHDTASEVVRALAEGPPAALETFADPPPEELRRWVERAMDRDPKARFSTALTMLDALDDCDAVGPEDTRPAAAASAFRAAVQTDDAPTPANATTAGVPRRAVWLLAPLTLALVAAGVALWPEAPAERSAPAADSALAPAPDPAALPPVATSAPAAAPAQEALPIGTRVLAPYGPRFRFPGTVVADNGDAVRVVFADGDVTSVPRVDVTPDLLVPGACVLRRRQRTGVRACITQRVEHAVRVTSPEGPPRWTSVMHLFVDPTAPSPGATAFEPAEAPEGTGPGSRVWARFRGGAEDFVGVVVERDEQRDEVTESDAGTRLRVVYFDGDTEWLGEDAVRPFALPPGSSVRAAPRRTATVDPDVGAAVVQERVGDAVHLTLSDGRAAWVALGQIAVPHP